MKNIFLILAMAYICYSCGNETTKEQANSETETKKPVAKTKANLSHISVEFINIKGEKVGSFESDIANDLELFNELISDEEVPMYKCGYNCKATLKFDDGSVIEADINTSEGCPHAVYFVGEEMLARKLGEDARLKLVEKKEESEKMVQ